MSNLRPFHYAFPIKNLEETVDFYTNVLGCAVGRATDKWVDFNFFGHQITAHVTNKESEFAAHNDVDGHSVPIAHSGVILAWREWEELADKIRGNNISFIIDPYVRFKNEPGEQATMFFKDPSGNALEFKAFKNDNAIFES
ncbi:MAG TPA: glyoxalase [Flavobacteriales bacterium]|nr:glyoxalase [Flavobacteriales bacterium]